MSARGLGDRWLAGDPIEGVAFGPGDPVRLRVAPTRAPGHVRLLMRGPPDPRYLVELGDGSAVRVGQAEIEGVE